MRRLQLSLDNRERLVNSEAKLADDHTGGSKTVLGLSYSYCRGRWKIDATIG